MKKVTVILSMFVIGFTGNAYSQKKPSDQMSINFTKVEAQKPQPKPGETGYMKITMEDALISSAQPKETAKPAAKPIAAPVKPKKASDYLMELDGIKGESPEPKK